MFAVGPPTSVIVPRKSSCMARSRASRSTDSGLRLWIERPWWKAIEQKVQSAMQPRCVLMLQRTGSRAGTPPAASWSGCHSRRKGRSYQRSTSSWVAGGSGGCCNTQRSPCACARMRPSGMFSSRTALKRSICASVFSSKSS